MHTVTLKDNASAEIENDGIGDGFLKQPPPYLCYFM